MVRNELARDADDDTVDASNYACEKYVAELRDEKPGDDVEVSDLALVRRGELVDKLTAYVRADDGHDAVEQRHERHDENDRGRSLPYELDDVAETLEESGNKLSYVGRHLLDIFGRRDPVLVYRLLVGRRGHHHNITSFKSTNIYYIFFVHDFQNMNVKI